MIKQLYVKIVIRVFSALNNNNLQNWFNTVKIYRIPVKMSSNFYRKSVMFG